MAENFYTIVTKVGLAKIANAQLTTEKVDFATIVVGDGNGSYYNPPSDATVLKNEVWRGTIGSIATDPDNPNWIVVETVIPATVGGFTVRELGLLDAAGDMIAIGKYPETYKPVLADGSSKDLYIRMIIEVANTSVVTLKVDPAVVIASRKYVDDKVKQASDSIKDGSLTLPSLGTANKTIPGAINEVKDGLASHAETAATTATAGHVKLSSAVTSSDETKAATPAAVKKVNDSLEILAGPTNSKSVKQLDTELGEHKSKNASSTEDGHMTAADKKKLDSVEEGANKYTHPDTHPATMITEDETHRFVTDAEKMNWDDKETPTGAQEKVDTLAGTGNTKTVKQLDEEIAEVSDALETHSADFTQHVDNGEAHGIGKKSNLKTTSKNTIVQSINELYDTKQKVITISAVAPLNPVDGDIWIEVD